MTKAQLLKCTNGGGRLERLLQQQASILVKGFCADKTDKMAINSQVHIFLKIFTLKALIMNALRGV